MSRRGTRPLSAVLLIAATAVVGCGGGNSNTGGVVSRGVNASFVASTTAAGPDMVRLRSVTTSSDLVTLEVAVGGPTTSNDLYSFAFDLLLSDPTVAIYVDGSAVFGNALTLGGGQGSTVLVTQTVDRIVIGVSKTGGGGGNGIGASEDSVVRLTLRVIDTGTTAITITGSPTNPVPTALDSAGSVVPSVVFDGGTAQLVGS